ncbi:MAG: hypothetical protein GXO91_06970 [FCB group bacterium]|nr:hypothetical protein [FCB group bacterium]
MINQKLILFLTGICISLFIGCESNPLSPAGETAGPDRFTGEPSALNRTTIYDGQVKSPLPSESRDSDIRSGFNNRNGLYDGDSLQTIVHP